MENNDFDTLVLCGSSIKCMTILGSLQYAYDHALLSKITKYIGTSSGSICCYLLAIGYTPIEIIVYLWWVDIASIICLFETAC